MKRCLGWAEQEGRCENEAVSKWGPLWCQTCDEKRIAHLSAQFAAISESFGPSGETATE
jgi:hypothetical protein